MKTLIAVLVLALSWTAGAGAADYSSQSVVLVAKCQLRDRFYGSTILVARPIGNDQHIGFIVNRPSKIRLSQLFPEHEPSKKVVDPVYVGGPINADSIFALVHTDKSPGGHSVRLTPNLFVVIDSSLVDTVIESEAGKARYVAGLVAWRSGELREEVKRGAWYVMDADPAVVLRKPTEGLWEELVRRSELKANGI
jgi:putative transcriptional regulator